MDIEDPREMEYIVDVLGFKKPGDDFILKARTPVRVFTLRRSCSRSHRARALSVSRPPLSVARALAAVSPRLSVSR